MRSIRTAALLSALVAAVPAAAGPPPATGRPDWIVGCWEGKRGDRRFYERWTKAGPEMLLGTSWTVSGDALREFEFLRIETRDGKLAYVAQPGGAPPTVFVLDPASGPGEAIFTNPDHDFPKRVAYRKGDRGSLLAWIDGGDGAPDTRVEYPMTRAACE